MTGRIVELGGEITKPTIIEIIGSKSNCIIIGVAASGSSGNTIYWQHHPALSYVFSGRFIDPTSQAPRVNGATETLYELEIAFAELDRVTADAESFKPEHDDLPPLPWNTDRLLRLPAHRPDRQHPPVQVLRRADCTRPIRSEAGWAGLLECVWCPPHAQIWRAVTPAGALPGGDVLAALPPTAAR